MLKQNYEIMCELDLEVDNGLVVDQETGLMIKNNITGKYLIVRIDDTSYVDWRYYEEFNPYFNFKQLKSLVEYYLNKIAIQEDRYFQIFATDTTETQMRLVVKGEEELSTRFFDKDKGYLCYIDLIYVLNGDFDADMSMFMEDRDPII